MSLTSLAQGGSAGAWDFSVVRDFTIAGMPVSRYRGKHRVRHRQAGRASVAGVVAAIALGLVALGAATSQPASIAGAVGVLAGAAFVAMNAMRGVAPEEA
jgi:hypothetical protein